MTISFGGKAMLDALVRIADDTEPIQVDYFNQGDQAKGTLQLGILKWIGDEVCFCMAAPGQARPADFDSRAGSGRTLSQWRVKK